MRGYETGKRHKVKKNFSDKVRFAQTSEKTKKLNNAVTVQKRGGIRL